MLFRSELHGPDFLRERRMQGSSMGSNHFRIDMPRLIQFYQQGRLHLDELISGRLKLEQINDGYKDMLEGRNIRGVIRYYTREAGVRSLEREVSKICRKVVKGLLLKTYEGRVVVTEDNLNDFLGVRKFDFGRAEKMDQVGQVVGLAWTEVGGDLLTIEATEIGRAHV